MKKNIRFIGVAILVSGLLLTSCKSGSENENGSQKDSTSVKVSDNCVYSYDNSTTKVAFTSYKFTKKVGVGGSFDQFTVNGGKQDKDPLNVIQNLDIIIPVSSINTNNKGRDENIVNYFFKTVGVDTIIGKVIAMDADKHQTTLLITMNGHSNMVVGDYTWKDNTYSFSADINVNDWEEGPGIKALNDKCKDLHTGKDGVSKLWPDVSLSFTTTLHKDCN